MVANNPKKAKVKTEDLQEIRSNIMRPVPKLGMRGIITALIVAVLLAWSTAGTEASPQKFVEGVPTLVDFIVRLMPPEFEFKDDDVHNVWAFTIFPPEARIVENAEKAERARRASADDVAALSEGQTLVYVYRETGADEAVIITPEEAAEIDAEAVHTLNPFIADEGFQVSLDEWENSVMIVEEGYRVINAVPYLDGQMVVAKRYVLDPGEFLIGYPAIIDSIVETGQIAIIGTILSILVSIPFALLAARNTSPHPIIYQVTRLFLNFVRSIPTLIYALIFVSAVGLGPFAGVLALVVGSIGGLGKLFAESFEQIDPNQVAAVRATGAGSIQVFNYAVLPQAFPLLATYALITFESNVRDSTILGIVGAGGVGFIIQKYTSLFQFQRLMGAVLIIVIMVTIIDRFSDYVRKRII